MGNAVSDQSVSKRSEKVEGNAALNEFIEDECPVLNKAIFSTDQRFRNSVVAEFSKVFSGQRFKHLSDVVKYMESKRLQRIQFLKSISEDRFSMTPAVKFPCIAIRIDDKIAMAFMDTGCGMSCLTRRAASKLGLESRIVSNVGGLASGFGNHTEIIGILSNIALQSGDMLFRVNFVVIENASADFIILGADFISKSKLKLNFRKGEVLFPRQVIEKQTVRFIPPIKNEDADELIVRMVENMNIPRSLRILPEVVNQRSIYINVRINSVSIQIMIDSGAEASMISGKSASRLKILQFTDLRLYRVSHGLGPVVIIGRIPPIPIEFDDSTTLFMPFDVLSGSDREIIILGSDFLTFYGCEIDFERNVLDVPLDRKRSYKLQEKQKSSTEFTNLFKDCGLEKLYGFESQSYSEKQPILPPTHSEQSSPEMSKTPLVLKPFQNEGFQCNNLPKRSSKADFIDVSLESLSAVTLSL